MNLAPYADSLGVGILRAGGGGPLLSMPCREPLMGRPGFLHGGAIGGLLEMAAVVTLTEVLEREGAEGLRIKPINLTVDYMRGGRPKASWARATITRLGARVANVEAIVWQDDEGSPIAAARLNYLIIRPAEAAAVVGGC